MDKLPDELLACIADCCEFASLKSLRSVDTKWHGLTTPLIFEHFYMGLFDHSLAKLQALASSDLAKHVKSLTFFCDVLPDCRRTAWEREVKSWLGPDYRTKVDINAAWDAYQDWAEEQSQWQHVQQGRTFRDAFLKLHSLVDARAVRTVAGDKNANGWPVWKRFTEQCAIGPDQWKVHRERSPNPFMEIDTDARAALALLEAMGERISHGHPPIPKLQLQLFAQNFYFMRPLGHEGFGHPVPPSWASIVKPKIRTAFANLSDLSLYLETPLYWEDFGGILAEFSDFLFHAKKLKRLSFWFEYSEDFAGNWPDEMLLHSDQIGFFSSDCAVWPEIEHLSLKVNVPSFKLLSFLKLHAGTLESLELRHMLVRDVPLLLENIPKILKLELICIQGLWHYGPGLPQEYLYDEINVCLLGYGTECDRPYESGMKKYLLREIEMMPDLNDDPLVRTKTGHGMNLLGYDTYFDDGEHLLDYESVASEE